METIQPNTTASDTQQLTGQVSAEQIQKWKAEHGKVFQYTVENKTCYLHSVDRNSYSLALVKMGSNPAMFNQVVIDNIWLGGDEELRKNDGYYFGLVEFVEELMAKKKGSLLEL